MRFIKKFIITLIVILLLGAGAAGGRLLWQGYQIYQEVIDGEDVYKRQAFGTTSKIFLKSL